MTIVIDVPSVTAAVDCNVIIPHFLRYDRKRGWANSIQHGPQSTGFHYTYQVTVCRLRALALAVTIVMSDVTQPDTLEYLLRVSADLLET
jgi:hypothetical protein